MDGGAVNGRTTGRVRAGLAIGVAAETLVLAVLRLGLLGPLPAGAPDDLLRLLLAVAMLLVAALTHRSHPTAAWLATIGAAAVVAVDLATYARVARPLVSAVAWQWLAIIVSFAAILAVASAATYAASRAVARGGRFTVETTVATTLAISGLAVWAITNPSATLLGLAEGSPIGSLGVVTRTFLLATVAFAALGVVGDTWPSAERAWRRAGLLQPAPASRLVRPRVWLTAFVDELSPGRRRARAAILEERARFAADLHADVVPGLRQTLSRAEAGATPAELALSLREVLADVEAVGAGRHAIQLDIGGLVPALAWLAERVERRSGVAITIDVADPPPETPEGAERVPPPDVAAAAFRIAGLALSNVAAHAKGSDAVIEVGAGPAAVDLSIRDAGPGVGPGAIAAARAAGHRGIVDMVAEASACGGTVEVGPGPDGVGTAVTFRWRAPTEGRAEVVAGRR
jgi:signal transduction histidine kinase